MARFRGLVTLSEEPRQFGQSSDIVGFGKTENKAKKSAQ
jgi:hypothetical protein